MHELDVAYLLQEHVMPLVEHRDVCKNKHEGGMSNEYFNSSFERRQGLTGYRARV
jgi:hypothetical protein